MCDEVLVTDIWYFDTDKPEDVWLLRIQDTMLA